jgi:hypothetical protein
MSGTDLLRLMIDVRAQLAIQNVELIILIEDLATLQGIDQQLLEALIIRPRQPDMPELCRLRTAVAMTSGYYEGLRKNVHQRFDFRVVMGDSDTRGAVSAQTISRFTARYLNATRLPDSVLDVWYSDQSIGQDSEQEPVPSACDACKFKKPCHAAFGESDGMGLYPFSPISIDHISRRISPKGFNPRTQLKEGYKPILETYATDLHDGRFPPIELIRRLGDTRLTTVADAEIRQKDPTNRTRRVALMDLWSNEPKVHDLDPVIHKAFDIPELRTEGGPRDLPRPDTPPNPPPNDPALARLTDRLNAIDAWRAGGTMSQDLAQNLREAVFPAIVAHIDWNSLHLIRGDFVGPSKVFRQANSIVFDRQILQGGRATIQLHIPMREQDPTDPALALQGLLLFSHYGSWAFDDGLKYYRAFARNVEIWADHVINQIDRLTESSDDWDPVPAAAEMLAIGARIFGRPRSRDPERQDVVDAVFSEIPDRTDGMRSESWEKLSRVVQKYQDKTREVVLSRVACSKGDSRQLQVIDVAHLLPALSTLRRNGRPVQVIPEDLVKSHKFLIEYRRGLEDLLDTAARDERAHQIRQYNMVTEMLGCESRSAEAIAQRRVVVVDALRKVFEAAVAAGVLTGSSRATLDEKLTAFEGVQLQAWAENVAKIFDEEDSNQLLTDLSLIPINAARVASETLELANQVLARTQANVRQGMGGTEGDQTKELNEVQMSIDTSLQTLAEALAAFPEVRMDQ